MSSASADTAGPQTFRRSLLSRLSRLSRSSRMPDLTDRWRSSRLGSMLSRSISLKRPGSPSGSQTGERLTESFSAGPHPINNMPHGQATDGGFVTYGSHLDPLSSEESLPEYEIHQGSLGDSQSATSSIHSKLSNGDHAASSVGVVPGVSESDTAKFIADVKRKYQLPPEPRNRNAASVISDRLGQITEEAEEGGSEDSQYHRPGPSRSASVSSRVGSELSVVYEQPLASSGASARSGTSYFSNGLPNTTDRPGEFFLHDQSASPAGGSSDFNDYLARSLLQATGSSGSIHSNKAESNISLQSRLTLASLKDTLKSCASKASAALSSMRHAPTDEPEVDHGLISAEPPRLEWGKGIFDPFDPIHDQDSSKEKLERYTPDQCSVGSVQSWAKSPAALSDHHEGMNRNSPKWTGSDSDLSILCSVEPPTATLDDFGSSLNSAFRDILSRNSMSHDGPKHMSLTKISSHLNPGLYGELIKAKHDYGLPSIRPDSSLSDAMSDTSYRVFNMDYEESSYEKQEMDFATESLSHPHARQQFPGATTETSLTGDPYNIRLGIEQSVDSKLDSWRGERW